MMAMTLMVVVAVVEEMTWYGMVCPEQEKENKILGHVHGIANNKGDRWRERERKSTKTLLKLVWRRWK
jgi:hypothetical protein